MEEQWIEEFLFRGRPPSGPDSEREPAFHVIIGQQEAGGAFRQLLGPVGADHAAALGWPITRLIATANAAAIQQLAEAKSEIARLKAELGRA